MHRRTAGIILALFVLVTTIPSPLFAAERRTALVIGNSSYVSGPLKNPVNDAADFAANLKILGFVVTLKTNATHQEMEDAIRAFGDTLKKGGVGLFYYAGHGTQIGGRNYLLPVGAKINKETDVKFQAVDAELVLAEMDSAGNNLNIVILDACRDNPFGRGFRSAGRGLAIISDTPKGTFIAYSTSPGKVAEDGKGRNSPYTESLIRHMNISGLQIEEVFKKVRKDLGRKTGGQQVPWELSSLEGRFSFRQDESSLSATKSSGADLNAEQSKIDAEKERVRKERELLEQQEALVEEERLLAEKRKKIAMGSQSSDPTAKEIGKDGRFIAYDNGTVLDTRTNLMWAARDSGSTINWKGAKKYCANYSGGGYKDWRLPTQHELGSLYDKSEAYKTECGHMVHLTEFIRLTCNVLWASDTDGYVAGGFRFGGGITGGERLSFDFKCYALPVRNAK